MVCNQLSNSYNAITNGKNVSALMYVLHFTAKGTPKHTGCKSTRTEHDLAPTVLHMGMYTCGPTMEQASQSTSESAYSHIYRHTHCWLPSVWTLGVGRSHVRTLLHTYVCAETDSLKACDVTEKHAINNQKVTHLSQTSLRSSKYDPEKLSQGEEEQRPQQGQQVGCLVQSMGDRHPEEVGQGRGVAFASSTRTHSCYRSCSARKVIHAGVHLAHPTNNCFKRPPLVPDSASLEFKSSGL